MNVETSIPHDRNAKERRDCTIIALTNLTGLPYNTAHALAQAAGRKARQGMISSVLLESLKPLGFKIEDQNIPLWALTTAGLARFFPTGSYYCTIKGHAFALIDGKILDTGTLRKAEFITNMWSINQDDLIL